MGAAARAGARAILQPDIVADAAFWDISGIAFCDRDAAARNLARVGERVPASVLVLTKLLAELPDPDSALNLFERLTTTAPPEVPQLLGRRPFLLHYALAIFSYSHYLGETLIQSPDLFPALDCEKALDRTHSRDEFAESFARFRSRSLDTDISLLLARFKRREYVRIMLRERAAHRHAGGDHE